MKVTVINRTTYAAELLIFTKSTRLNMTPGLWDDINGWPEERKDEELAYMATTIPSSWEFVDIVFLVEGLSRAAAQQVTRTRTASYAMQSQRVNDMSGVGVVSPEFNDALRRKVWSSAVENVMDAYTILIKDGVAKQDARGILPMNSECNIVIKYNLRTFVDMLAARESLRAQGEYAEMAAKMKELLLALWPWAAPFFKSKHAAAIEKLEEVAKSIGVTTGSGPGWEIAKAIDLLRKS